MGLVVGLGTSVAAGPAQGADQRRQPNIVLVMLDDLGFSDLGCYGAPIIQTPTIDGLAQDGVRFTQFYNTGKCHTSRISLLTGLYAHQAGNRKIRRGATLAEALKQAGYFTAMTGKWHLGGQPTEFGFQRYFGHLSGACNFFTGQWRGNDAAGEAQNTWYLNGEKFTDFGEDFYTTRDETDYAIKFIDQALKQDKPFFSYLAYNAPHYPLQAPKEAVMRYRDKFKAVGWDKLRQRRYQRQVEMGLIESDWALSPRPDYLPAWDKLTPSQRDFEDLRMATYAAMVELVDRNLNRLIDHLKEKGEWENTLLLLCSDNGACPYDRTQFKHLKPWNPRSFWCYDPGWAHVGNTPFRWYKQNQHEGGIASPLIAHWPNGLGAQSGSWVREPSHLIDIMPTLLEAADAAYPAQQARGAIESPQGQSLLPLLKGESFEGHDWLYFLYADNRAIRRGPWKLVSAEQGAWELYNMQRDRTELNNLVDEKPELVGDLKKLWHRVAKEVDGAPKYRRQPLEGGKPTFPKKHLTDR
jgi:arylsulfatase